MRSSLWTVPYQWQQVSTVIDMCYYQEYTLVTTQYNLYCSTHVAIDPILLFPSTTAGVETTTGFVEQMLTTYDDKTCSYN